MTTEHSAAEPGTELAAFSATDVGLHREGNEDSYFSGQTVFAVADGMGGHAAGEVASRTALEPIAALDGRSFDSAEAAQQAVVEAIAAANTAVVAEGDADPSLQGMGTTLTAVIVREGRLHIAHVGDSRAYLLRAGEGMHQLTTDHTLVEQLVREGRLSREQAAVHPQRSVVTRAIGVEREVQIDSLPELTLQPGDQVLLCSDGLTGPVEDTRIAALLTSLEDGQEAVEALIDAANEEGGPDNITVVLLRVSGGSAPAAAPAPAQADDSESTGDLPAAEQPPRPPVRSAEGAQQIRTRVESDPQSLDWAERMGRYGQEQGAPGAPAPRKRRRRIAATIIGVLILLALVGAGGYWMLQRAFFVGDDDGQIAIFNGIPGDVAGVSLHWVHEATDLETDRLPSFQAQRVRDGVFTAANLVEAREIVERFRAQIDDAQDRTRSDEADDPDQADTGADAEPDEGGTATP